MMRCKLFFFHVVAFALHSCFLQLTSSASVNGDANSTASCNSSVMECANLVNISYPFWGSAGCAASPSYVLSNCTSSSTEVFWDSFSTTANAVGPPAVTDLDVIYSAHNSTREAEVSIQLSWNRSLSELGLCAPLFSSRNLSLYNIPPSINLTRFSDSSALEFAANSSFLLFNCTHLNTSKVVAQWGRFVTESVSLCIPYKGLCPSMAKMPCVEWSLPASLKELMLQEVLDSLACSHFMFGVLSLNEFGSTDWSTGWIELIWRDIQCKRCLNASGFCIYDLNVPTKFSQCMCGNGVPLDFRTQTYCGNDNVSECDGGLLKCSTGAKIGIAVAFIVVLLAIWIGTRRFKDDIVNICVMIRDGIRSGFVCFTKVTIPVAINVLKKALRKLQSVSYSSNTSLNDIDFDGLTERPMEYSYSSIASATKSFSNLLGEGGFGSVYKGALTQSSSDGGGSELLIAVKVLGLKSKHNKKQFLNEVVTIGRVHHVNIVRLLGFCMQEDHEMLVYEYVVNRSLDRWLFGGKGNAQDKVLDWGQRHAIALGVARGLSYLHEECRHRTVHCDIKPQNILLDEDMQPKIADFGLARLMGRNESKVVTFAKGTPGYMAPEFWMGGESQLTAKFDVYSYGMVLLELISGHPNFRSGVTLSSSSSFPVMAFKAAMEEDLQSILDSRLNITSDGGDEAQKQAQWNQIRTAVLVALWCIQDHPARRPSMSEVVKYLEGGAAVSECPPQPNMLTFSQPSVPDGPLSSKNEDDWTPLSIGR